MALALSLALVLAWGLGRSSGNLSIAFDASAAVRVAIGGLILGGLGAISPLIKIWRVDPASVFRR